MHIIIKTLLSVLEIESVSGISIIDRSVYIQVRSHPSTTYPGPLSALLETVANSLLVLYVAVNSSNDERV